MRTETATATEAAIFLTDYASYNNGTQFEFGHWVNLSNFEDETELSEYFSKHFAEADKKSPLKCGSIREETMFTDYEGIPSIFYSESGMDFKAIYEYLETWKKVEDYNLSQWIELHNENSQVDENGETQIFYFDQDFFNTFFEGNPEEAARATAFGSVNWSDEYIQFDGYGNLESLSDYSAERQIDKEKILASVIENPRNYSI